MARWLNRGEASVFRSSSFSQRSFAANSWRFDGSEIFAPASLGGFRTPEKKHKQPEIDDEIQSPLSVETVSRIRSELLAGVLADEVISRAQRRKTARAEEEALLLMI